MIITTGTPTWLLELTDAKTDYVERLGWDVRIEIGNRRLVMPVGEQVDAISMPSNMGQSVHDELQMTTPAGPVFVSSNAQRWTFLTKPAAKQRPNVASELFALRVHVVPRGANVVIPQQRDADEWLHRPEPGQELPPWSKVIEATRKVGNALQQQTLTGLHP